MLSPTIDACLRLYWWPFVGQTPSVVMSRMCSSASVAARRALERHQFVQQHQLELHQLVQRHQLERQKLVQRHQLELRAISFSGGLVRTSHVSFSRHVPLCAVFAVTSLSGVKCWARAAKSSETVRLFAMSSSRNSHRVTQTVFHKWLSRACCPQNHAGSYSDSHTRNHKPLRRACHIQPCRWAS